MKNVCSVHTHSTMCDGKDPLSEMARAACEAGAVSFGASGHSHTEVPWDQGGVLPLDLTEYRDELLRLREAYAGRMEVLLGIEQDSLSPQSVPEWADYWIGSVHNLRRPEGFASVDYSPEKLEKDCRTMFRGDFLAMVEAYFGDVAAMAARKPTILGHIDLIAKFNEDGYFFDEADPGYRAAALGALHGADPKETLLEINTGAMSRGYRSAPYPALFLLREWRAMGGKIILTVDAHSAETVVFGYDQAAELARAAGFRRSTLLTAAGREERPLDL